MQQNEKLTRTQMLMAANAPIFIKRAMVEGHPADGVLPSGQVAGVIEDLPTCAELIDRIIAEAEQTLNALAAGQNAKPERPTKSAKEGTAIAS
jgi:NAD(P)H-dependent flavin oxidoreductase YrpB (nitropropane dioxygenase family)